ncbi:MAG TPA: hypothetical protein VLJ44_12190 [Gaiellaceae bacterium]|nr:hypothetical protein [Gaiellaceae bacterium]
MASTEFSTRAAHGSHAASAVGVRRYVNDEIARVGTQFDVGETTAFEFLCECGRLGCDGLVRLTLAEYQGSAPGSVIAHR